MYAVAVPRARKKPTIASLQEMVIALGKRFDYRLNKEIGDVVSIIQNVHVDLSTRIDKVDAKIDEKTGSLHEEMNFKFSALNRRMDDLAYNHVRTGVHEALEKRVTKLEKPPR